MDIMEASVLHHVAIVLFLLWLLTVFNRCHPFAYFISFIYLYLVRFLGSSFDSICFNLAIKKKKWFL
uniref:Uncharacterized protein n=1 Tax=Rhizophora mucronata TaxID=61149 RepID=A0A2P2MDN6_RHIMU